MLKKTCAMYSLCFVAAVMMTGCDKAAEKAGDKLTEELVESALGGGADIDIQRDGEQITIKSDEGEMTISAGESAELPENFPKDVPLPSGLAVEGSMTMPQGLMVSGTLSGKADAVITQMKQEMQRNGWKETMNMSSDGATMNSYSKADRVVNFSFDTSGDNTAVSIIVAKDSA